MSCCRRALNHGRGELKLKPGPAAKDSDHQPEQSASVTRSGGSRSQVRHVYANICEICTYAYSCIFLHVIAYDLHLSCQCIYVEYMIYLYGAFYDSIQVALRLLVFTALLNNVYLLHIHCIFQVLCNVSTN
jgi:hypothetical protein